MFAPEETMFAPELAMFAPEETMFGPELTPFRLVSALFFPSTLTWVFTKLLLKSLQRFKKN